MDLAERQEKDEIKKVGLRFIQVMFLGALTISLENFIKKQKERIPKDAIIPETFPTLKEAIKVLNLDKSKKWRNINGHVFYEGKYQLPFACKKCEGKGCEECNQTGYLTQLGHIPAYLPNGELVTIKNPKI
jgi:hypothetical protein